MRHIIAGSLILLCLFVLGAVSVADNPMGIKDSYKVDFSEKVLVAGTLLPKGTYQISHVMEGSDHIMIFRQLDSKKPVEVRAKCTLVPLGAKATRDEKSYTLNASNERVLHELVFKGDSAGHVF
ncbi:MAG: hypothetical protein WA718_18285 [Terriglobales bacterium]